MKPLHLLPAFLLLAAALPACSSPAEAPAADTVDSGTEVGESFCSRISECPDSGFVSCEPAPGKACTADEIDQCKADIEATACGDLRAFHSDACDACEVKL